MIRYLYNIFDIWMILLMIFLIIANIDKFLFFLTSMQRNIYVLKIMRFNIILKNYIEKRKKILLIFRYSDIPCSYDFNLL